MEAEGAPPVAAPSPGKKKRARKHCGRLEARVAALQAELAAVEAERDEWKRRCLRGQAPPPPPPPPALPEAPPRVKVGWGPAPAAAEAVAHCAVDLERALAADARAAQELAGALDAAAPFGRPFPALLRVFDRPEFRLTYDARSGKVGLSPGAAAPWLLAQEAPAAGSAERLVFTIRLPHSTQGRYLAVEGAAAAVQPEASRWELRPARGRTAAAFLLRECASGAYLMGHCGQVGVTASPHDALQWNLLPARDVPEGFLYRHDVPGMGRRAEAALAAAVPEAYPTVAALRNQADGGADPVPNAGDIRASRAVATGVVGVALCLAAADPALDLAVMMTYFGEGEEVWGGLALAVLCLSGVCRGVVTYRVLAAHLATHREPWTRWDCLYLLASLLPLPLVDIAELAATMWRLAGLEDVAFAALQPVRLRRTQLRSATTALSEALPQLCLQGYVYAASVTRVSPTLLLASLFTSAASVVWMLVLYVYDAAGRGRGAWLEVCDLTDRELKNTLAHSSTLGWVHAMTPRQFAEFHDLLGGMEFRTLRFDDVQLLLDHAPALLHRWAHLVHVKNAGVLYRWRRKEVVLAGCVVNWHRLVAYAGARWRRMTPYDRRQPKQFMADCLEKLLVPWASPLGVLHEVAFEKGVSIPSLQSLLAAQDRAVGERRADARFRPPAGRDVGVLLLGPAAGGKPLDRYGAQMAAAILRAQRCLRHCVLSGNMLGTEDVERKVPWADEHDLGVLDVANSEPGSSGGTEPMTPGPGTLEHLTLADDVFHMIEGLGSGGANGRFDLSDFRAAFRHHPTLRAADVAAMFAAVATSQAPEAAPRGHIGPNTTVSQAEWRAFAAANPHTVRSLHVRLQAGLTYVLSAVVHASRRAAFQLTCVDVRGCRLTNGELWSCARIAMVECARPVRILLRGGNGADGVDAFVQDVIDQAAASRRGAAALLRGHAPDESAPVEEASSSSPSSSSAAASLPPTEPPATPTGDVGDGDTPVPDEREEVTFEEAVLLANGIDCKCVLSLDDFAAFACAMADFAAARARACAPEPVTFTLSSSVRVAQGVHSERAADEGGSVRLSAAVGCFLDARRQGVGVEWSGDDVHGALGDLLTAAAAVPALDSATAHPLPACTVVSPAHHPAPRGALLRLNALLWQHRVPVLHAAWAGESPVAPVAARAAALRDYYLSGRALPCPPADVVVADAALTGRDADAIAEMLALLAHEPQARRGASRVALVRCAVDASLAGGLMRCFRAGAAALELRECAVQAPEVAALLRAAASAFALRSLRVEVEGAAAAAALRVAVAADVAGLHAVRPDVVVHIVAAAEAAVQPQPPLEAHQALLAHLVDGGAADAAAASPEGLARGLAAYRTPTGAVWGDHTIDALAAGCDQMVQRCARGPSPQPAEVVAPIYIYTSAPTREVLWAVGAGPRWAPLDAGAAAALERLHSEAGGSWSALPDEVAAAIGVGVGGRWARGGDGGDGVARYHVASGTARLVRYGGGAPGEPTVLWCPPPWDVAAPWAALPPSDVVEHVVTRRPEAGLVLGGAEAGWTACAVEVPAPEAPIDEMECLRVPAGEWAAYGLQFNPAPPGRAGIVLAHAAHEKAVRFVGRRCYTLNGASLPSDGGSEAMEAARAAAAAGGGAGDLDLRFWPRPGGFAAAVKAAAVHGMCLWLVSYRGCGATAWEDALVARSPAAGLDSVSLIPLNDGAAAGGDSAVPPATVLQRVAAGAPRPGAVLDGVLCSVAAGRLAAELVVGAAPRASPGLPPAGTVLTAIPPCADAGAVVLRSADHEWQARWEPPQADSAPWAALVADGAWRVHAAGQDTAGAVLSRRHAAYDPGGWLLAQVRPFAFALQRALWALGGRGGAGSSRLEPLVTARAAPDGAVVWSTFGYGDRGVPAADGAAAGLFTAPAAPACWAAPYAWDAVPEVVLHGLGAALPAAAAVRAALRGGVAAADVAGGDRAVLATLHKLSAVAAQYLGGAGEEDPSKAQVVVKALLKDILCAPALFHNDAARPAIAAALHHLVVFMAGPLEMTAAGVAAVLDPLPDPPPPHHALLRTAVASVARFAAATAGGPPAPPPRRVSLPSTAPASAAGR